jgi:hypothetical protein
MREAVVEQLVVLVRLVVLVVLVAVVKVQYIPQERKAQLQDQPTQVAAAAVP